MSTINLAAYAFGRQLDPMKMAAVPSMPKACSAGRRRVRSEWTEREETFRMSIGIHGRSVLQPVAASALWQPVQAWLPATPCGMASMPSTRSCSSRCSTARLRALARIAADRPDK